MNLRIYMKGEKNENTVKSKLRGGGTLGFTLSEVLITLGIIGVVAAITVPTLINNIQNKQNIAAWKVLYSQISNSYNYTIENGYVCSYDLLEEFIEEFTKNFEVVDSCYGASCANNKKNKWQGITFSDVGTGYKTLAGGSFSAYNINKKAILLKNGAVIYLGGSHGGPWISVDVNGYKKGPNVIGKDFFIVKPNGTKALPLGAEGTYDKQKNSNECVCDKNHGTVNGNYFVTVGGGDSGKVVSGGCCSAYYLYGE